MQRSNSGTESSTLVSWPGWVMGWISLALYKETERGECAADT